MTQMLDRPRRLARTESDGGSRLMLDRLLGHVLDTVGAERGVVLRRDTHEPDRLVVAAHDEEESACAAPRGDLRLERGMAREALRGERPIVVRGGPRLRERRRTPRPTRAGIAVAVGCDGALVVVSHRPDWRPGSRELELVVLAGELVDRALSALATSDSVAAPVYRLQAELAAHDGETHEHCREVGDLACTVGRACGLGPLDLAELLFAAELHDLGKSALPQAILRKPEALDEDEWRHVRRHPALGAEMLAGVPGMAPVGWLVHHHHEHWDGTGYPHGLEGERIPLASRIIAACDAYLAMVRDRPYRRARSPAAAIRELRAGAGTQWDPRVIEALLGVVPPPAGA